MDRRSDSTSVGGKVTSSISGVVGLVGSAAHTFALIVITSSWPETSKQCSRPLGVRMYTFNSRYRDAPPCDGDVAGRSDLTGLSGGSAITVAQYAVYTGLPLGYHDPRWPPSTQQHLSPVCNQPIVFENIFIGKWITRKIDLRPVQRHSSVNGTHAILYRKDRLPWC